MTAEMDNLVQEYLQKHPGYEYPPSGDTHPCVLALSAKMKAWLIDRLGGPEAFWEAMLRSARVWFTPRSDQREYRIFCNLFEAEGNVFWGGNPRLEALTREYLEWKRG